MTSIRVPARIVAAGHCPLVHILISVRACPSADASSPVTELRAKMNADFSSTATVPERSAGFKIAVGTRIDRLYLGPIVPLVPIAITAAQSAGDPCWNAAMPALAFLAVVGLALFVADATLTVRPICLAECK